MQEYRQEFFALPNELFELFFLNLSHGAITVYAYLLCCERQRTHQCQPSYQTIVAAVYLIVPTAMRHITKPEDNQLITFYVGTHQLLGQLRYEAERQQQCTILPVQITLDCYYQQQMLLLKVQQKQQRAEKHLGRNPEKAPVCTAVRGCVADYGTGESPIPFGSLEENLGRFLGQGAAG